MTSPCSAACRIPAWTVRTRRTCRSSPVPTPRWWWLSQLHFRRSIYRREIGHLTRFPSLTLGVNASVGRRSLSWTDAGVLIPCENRASSVYRRLFLQGSEEEIERQVRKLQLGESIMDTLAQESKALTRRSAPPTATGSISTRRPSERPNDASSWPALGNAGPNLPHRWACRPTRPTATPSCR